MKPGLFYRLRTACRSYLLLCSQFFLGEFGQVYKGYMKTKFKSDVVAVKTLRGM